MNNEKKFIKLTPFKMQVLQSFPFIDADFDALTNYELLCKVVEYLNTTVDNVDLLNEKVEEFEHYFDNLDVQEEINNKLDEMAEDGTLEEIITSYINSKAIFCFDTLNDMINSTNLISGSYAKTLGYYNINDGGGSLYYINNNNYETNNYSNILLNNNLKANLLYKKSYNVEVFGAKGDGETDDRLAIQNAINYSNEINFLNKTYMINCVDNTILDDDIHKYKEYNGGINILSNRILKGNNTILRCITNNSENYAILRCCEENNIIIENITLMGDKTTHTGVSGEWGHCLMILNSSDIIINNCKILEAWGDGIYVGVLSNSTIQTTTNNIKINNCLINGNRRNGISCCSVDNILIEDNIISNNKGKNPQSGIDIESEGYNPILKNISIHNNKFDNNKYGIYIYFNNTNVDFDILEINDNIFKDGDTGLIITTASDLNKKISGLFNILNNSFINNGWTAFLIRNYYTNYFDKMIIKNLYIKNPNNTNHNIDNNAIGYMNGSGLVIIKTDDVSNDFKVGNIIIENLQVIDTRETIYTNKAFYFSDRNGICNIEKILLINPIELTFRNSGLIAQGCKIIDTSNILVSNGSYYESLINKNNFNSLYLSSGTSGTLRSVLLDDNDNYIPNGTKIKILNDSNTKKLQIKCGSSSLLNVYNLDDTTKRYIRCTDNNIGAYLILEKINDIWLVTDYVGNWTRSDNSF